MVVIYIKNKMTNEEKTQWDELYRYVKKEILQYDDNQSIPTNLVLRLKGLQNGKLMANNKTQNNADYSYEIILYTFKLNKQNILSAISGKTFKDEMSKFIYITRIIENNINDVYLRITNAKKLKKKTEDMNISNVYHKGAEYQKKTSDNKLIDKYKDLW